MHVSIHLTEDQSTALGKLKDAGARMLAPLAQAWAGGAQEVLGRAVKNRFTGKGPFPVAQNRLGIVTNRLRKSLRATGGQVDAATGTASVSMGSNVSYYAGHEFGFRGSVQVKGHTRKAVGEGSRNIRGGQTRKTISGRKQAAKRGRANFSYVRPHGRKVNIPARKPLGTELESINTRLTMWKRIGAVVNRILKLK